MSELKSFAPSSGLSSTDISDDSSRLIGDVSGAAVSLNRAHSSDEPFLYRTYASARAEEMELTGWPEEVREKFLHMQYEAQQQSYRMQLPNAAYWVIQREAVPVGRLILDHSVREIQVVDIALLPEFRGTGIGRVLMNAILNEASRTGKEVRLHVERFNPALHWYERLGFRAISSGPIYFEMVWRSPQSPSSCMELISKPEQIIGAAHVDLSD